MRHLRRALLGVALLAAAVPAPGLPAANAAAPDTPPVGTITMDPPTGTKTSEFRLRPIGGSADHPTNAFCPGDSANDSYRWQTFIAPPEVDPATLEYDGEGVHTTLADDAAFQPFVYNLYSTSEDRVFDGNTAVNPRGFLDLSGNYFAFTAFPAEVLPAGTYNIGIACSKNRVTETYWALQIELSADHSYTVTTALSAPVLTDPLGVGDGSLTATFAIDPPADPPVTSYTVTAAPTAGGAPVVLSVTSSPAQITGLVNDTDYSVTVTATNASGTSVPSNAVVGTPRAAAAETTTTTTSSTTTTLAGTDETTTTTTASGGSASSTSSSVATAGASPAAASSTSAVAASSDGSLPSTGSSTLTVAIWAAVILALGRAVFLLGRRPKILPPK